MSDDDVMAVSGEVVESDASGRNKIVWDDGLTDVVTLRTALPLGTAAVRTVDPRTGEGNIEITIDGAFAEAVRRS